MTDPRVLDEQSRALVIEAARLRVENKRKYKRDMRRAFWLGTVAPVLVMLCLVVSGLLLYGAMK